MEYIGLIKNKRNASGIMSGFKKEKNAVTVLPAKKIVSIGMKGKSDYIIFITPSNIQSIPALCKLMQSYTSNKNFSKLTLKWRL